MLRLKHLGVLVREVTGYSVANRRWWVIPLVATLVVLAAVVTVGQTVVPYSVYTLF